MKQGSRVRFLVIILYFLFIMIQPIQASMEKPFRTREVRSLQAIHDPILILNNSDFETQGWSGAGTEFNPYVIDSLLIEASIEGFSIFISNITVHFTIRNCRIIAEDRGYAVSIRNSTHGRVDGCTFYENFCEIRQSNNCVFESNSGSFDMVLWECINCTISGNELEKVNIEVGGIIMDDCVNCSILRNTIKGALEEGLWILRGSNCTVADNEFAQNIVGISLLGANNTKILRNQVRDNKYYGVELYCASNTTVINNTLVNNGIVINLWGWGWNGHEYYGEEFVSAGYYFEGNFVNGKPLGFFEKNANDTVDAEDYGQVILLNCDNMQINNGYLNNTSVGFQVLFSQNCTLSDIRVENCASRGIEVFHSKDIKIQGCRLTNNSDAGVIIEASSDVKIINNWVTLSDNAIGLLISNKCAIVNNSVTYNSGGITLYGSMNCSIVNNTILYNRVGISLNSRAWHNIIFGNSIGWNDYANAFSDAGLNQWDDGISQGNAWSDYSGIGEYEIEDWGVDHYPTLLMGSSTDTADYTWIITIGITVVGIIVVISYLMIRKRKVIAK